MIDIQDISAKTEEIEILRGFSLKIQPGKTHVIMGPNGAGKSTLAKVLAGHPLYEVTKGKILFEGKDLLQLEPEERAHLGLFMSFQYPMEIQGISNFQFLFASLNALRKASGKKEMSKKEFADLLDKKMEKMCIPNEFKDRSINEGFSGGEKKRNEILQMAVLDPKLAILDETDSGLDIDAMRVVADGINAMRREDNSLLLITHYQRLLNYIQPDFVHVMVDGAIVKSGGKKLALELEEEGYDRFMTKELA